MSQQDHPVRDRRSNPDRTCSVCLQGRYVTRSGHEFSKGGGDKTPWHVEACSYCGHVQLFRRDWRERR